MIRLPFGALGSAYFQGQTGKLSGSGTVTFWTSQKTSYSIYNMSSPGYVTAFSNLAEKHQINTKRGSAIRAKHDWTKCKQSKNTGPWWCFNNLHSAEIMFFGLDSPPKPTLSVTHCHTTIHIILHSNHMISGQINLKNLSPNSSSLKKKGGNFLFSYPLVN